HEQGSGDGGEEQGHGEGQAQVGAEEADVDGVGVLDDEDHHHDEAGGAGDEVGGAEPLAEGRGRVLVVPSGAGVWVMVLLPEGSGPFRSGRFLAQRVRGGLRLLFPGVCPQLTWKYETSNGFLEY